MNKDLLTLKDEFLQFDAAGIDMFNASDRDDAAYIRTLARRLVGVTDLVLTLCDRVHTIEQELQQRKGDNK